MNQPPVGSDQKAKSRLGRGLSSLMAAAELPVQASVPTVAATPDTSLELRIDQISVNPHQPRRQFDDVLLQQLAESIKANGLIQPIVVRQFEKGYQLIAGERRWRAAKLAGLQTIRVHIVVADEHLQSQWALVENIHRSDLNPIERAEAYANLMQLANLTQQALAAKVGEDRSTVANHLRLLDLCPVAIALLRNGDLSLGHAKVLAAVADPRSQEALATRIKAEQLSVRQLESIRDETQKQADDTGKPANQHQSAHLADLEKLLARELGLKVNIRSTGRGKGKLTIRYASLEQFDDLMARMKIAMKD